MWCLTQPLSALLELCRPADCKAAAAAQTIARLVVATGWPAWVEHCALNKLPLSSCNCIGVCIGPAQRGAATSWLWRRLVGWQQTAMHTCVHNAGAIGIGGKWHLNDLASSQAPSMVASPGRGGQAGVLGKVARWPCYVFGARVTLVLYLFIDPSWDLLNHPAHTQRKHWTLAGALTYHHSRQECHTYLHNSFSHHANALFASET